ncbi:putative chitinase [Pseudomonas fluorescens]|uniref:hypothetical protein n=1 Tax=Pseudomonas fluorescens TaxID=294 RepID=UPI003F59C01F|nr:putative chitinase [Pseudomonas fluorescens]
MMISELQVSTMLFRSGPAAKLFTSLLNKAMRRYEINNKQRIAAFIAKIGYESGELRYLRERDHALCVGKTLDMEGDVLRYGGRGLIQIKGLITTAIAAQHWSWTWSLIRNGWSCPNMPACLRPGIGTARA